MIRLLGFLFLATLVAPIATGVLAVVAGFGDPWGMGNRDPVGIFITAALPITVPGVYQIFAWPATFGVALAFSPLATIGKGRIYRIAMLAYLGAIALVWLACWSWAPEFLNSLFDLSTFRPGRLESRVWKAGLFLLVDAALVAIAVLVWARKVEPRVPGTPRT